MANSPASHHPRGLIFSGVRGDTRRYRTIHLWEQANLLGLDWQLIHLTDPRLAHRIADGWDFVVLHRVPYDNYIEGLVKKARVGGALIIFDVDDLIFDVSAFQYINSPDFVDPLRSALYQDTMLRIRRTLECSDAVTASTDYLAGVTRQLGKPVWIHRNAFNLEMLNQSQAASAGRGKTDRVVIGYASGTLTHNQDFAVVKPALKEVLAACPETDLMVIGPLDIGDDWGSLSERVQHLPLVPWRHLPSLLARFDINLAPLVVGNPFAQSKSEIKFMEAAMVGTPTVASPTDAFRFAIHEGETGFTAGSQAEWKDTLVRLVKDSHLREEIGRAAQAQVLEQYHPAARADALQHTLSEIETNLRGGLLPIISKEEIYEKANRQARNVPWVDPVLEHDPSNVQLGRYTLAHRGPGTLMKQIWIYVRRLVSPVFPFRSS